MPKKAGRPRIEIDWTIFDQLCAIQCTLAEMAAWFKCSPDTLQHRCYEVKGENFSAYYEKKAAGGKMSLRRQQFQLAAKGNCTMLIWLGKQHLHQADKLEQSGPDGGPIQVQDVSTILKQAKDKTGLKDFGKEVSVVPLVALPN